MYRHSVILKLNPLVSGQQKEDFFDAILDLANIPGVQNLEFLKQVSSKNDFEYGISMEFTSEELYKRYSDHPQHTFFIENFWLKNVKDFLEIDYVSMG
jgi:hypothetical protein